MAPSLSNKRLGKFVQQLKRKNGEAIRTQRAGKLYNARYQRHRSRFWALVKNYILHLQHFSSSRFAHFCTASNSKFQQTFAIFFQEFWKHLEYLNRIRRFPDRFRLFLGIQTWRKHRSKKAPRIASWELLQLNCELPLSEIFEPLSTICQTVCVRCLYTYIRPKKLRALLAQTSMPLFAFLRDTRFFGLRFKNVMLALSHSRKETKRAAPAWLEGRRNHFSPSVIQASPSTSLWPIGEAPFFMVVAHVGLESRNPSVVTGRRKPSQQILVREWTYQ